MKNKPETFQKLAPAKLKLILRLSSLESCLHNLFYFTPFQILLRDFFSSAKKRRTGYEFSEHALTWYWSSCVAALPLMAAFGGYGGSKCANKIGRRKTLLCNNILLILAGLMQGLSKPLGSYELFLLGRIVVGKC